MNTEETVRTDAQWNDVLKKLESIRALRDRASTPEEAEAAAAALTRMLTKYSLTMVEFESRASRADGRAGGSIKTTITIENTAIWRQHLLTGIARANGCRAIFVKQSSHVFMVGPERNIQIVTDLYEELVALAETMARRASREPANAYSVLDAGMRSWKRSYLIGWGSGLYDAMRAARAQAADEVDGGSALVVVQERNLNEDVRRLIGATQQASGSRVNRAAHSAGYSDGEKSLTKRLD